MNEEELELLRQATELTTVAGLSERAVAMLKQLLNERRDEILTEFPGLGSRLVDHLDKLIKRQPTALSDCERREVAVAINDKKNCGPAPTDDLEAQLRCVLKTVIRESTATTGSEGVCAVTEMLTGAKRIAAQRKFLYGLYDLYVNAALASGLPNDQLPSAVRGGRGGQEGDNGGSRPSAP
jgi:hypothetical protein